MDGDSVRFTTLEKMTGTCGCERRTSWADVGFTVLLNYEDYKDMFMLYICSECSSKITG